MGGNSYLLCQGSLMILRVNICKQKGECLPLPGAQNIFILRCTKKVISTDHESLLGILNNKQDINSIANPCISNLKQKTFRYEFTTQYNPGKWNRGPHAYYQNPVAELMIHSICTEPNSNDISECEKIEALTPITVQTNITDLYKNEQISVSIPNPNI